MVCRDAHDSSLHSYTNAPLPWDCATPFSKQGVYSSTLCTWIWPCDLFSQRDISEHDTADIWRYLCAGTRRPPSEEAWTNFLEQEKPHEREVGHLSGSGWGFRHRSASRPRVVLREINIGSISPLIVTFCFVFLFKISHLLPGSESLIYDCDFLKICFFGGWEFNCFWMIS